jgi:hypothetical protein
MPDNELVERYVEHRKVTRALNTYKNACSVSRALLPLPYWTTLPIVVVHRRPFLASPEG